MASLVPVTISRPMRSPTGSWLAAATSPARVASPVPNSAPPINGTKGTPLPSETRRARQDKKKLSLAFFRGDAALDKYQKHDKQAPEDPVDSASATASSRSLSKDRGKNGPTSPPPPSSIEALPRIRHEASQHSLARSQSHGQSIDGRPMTGKSGRSEKSEHQKTANSMRKRLSLLKIGKKSSRSSVKSHAGNTLVEE